MAKRTPSQSQTVAYYAKAFRCACGSDLRAIWDYRERRWKAICGRNEMHTDFRPRQDEVIERIRGMPGTPEQIEEAINIYINHKEKVKEGNTMAQLPAVQQQRLEKYKGMMELTREDIEDIVKTIYPQAPVVEIKKVILLCMSYKLNPLPSAKHVYLLSFVNHKSGERTYSPVLAIGATRLIARRASIKHHHEYGYADYSPRAMTEEEQIKINGKVDDNRIWAITILIDLKGLTAYGVGNWPKDQAVNGADKGNTPENMARVRSERNALDRLFPGEMPGTEVEVIDADYETQPMPNALVEAPEGQGAALSSPVGASSDKPANAQILPPPEAKKTTVEDNAGTYNNLSKEPPENGLYQLRLRNLDALAKLGKKTPAQITDYLNTLGFGKVRFGDLSLAEQQELAKRLNPKED